MTAETSLYTFRLDVDQQYIPMINDLLRISIIQIVAQILFSIVRKESTFSLMSDVFLQTILFLLIGVLFYWLIVTKIVTITSSYPPPSPDLASPPAPTAAGSGDGEKDREREREATTEGIKVD